jgi:hypothetical protein
MNEIYTQAWIYHSEVTSNSAQARSMAVKDGALHQSEDRVDPQANPVDADATHDLRL